MLLFFSLFFPPIGYHNNTKQKIRQYFIRKYEMIKDKVFIDLMIHGYYMRFVANIGIKVVCCTFWEIQMSVLPR